MRLTDGPADVSFTFACSMSLSGQKTAINPNRDLALNHLAPNLEEIVKINDQVLYYLANGRNDVVNGRPG